MKTYLVLLCCCLLQAASSQNFQNLRSGKFSLQSVGPIGVFDSGTGGLTVLEAMLRLDAFHNDSGAPGSDGIPDFKGEYFQYLADQANMPYGNYATEGKTDFLKEQILRCMTFLYQDKQYDIKIGSSFLQKNKLPVKMIVVACNTATAYALPDIKARVGEMVPVVGVIEAGCKAALAYHRLHPGTIGVFATVGTVASDGYPRTLRKLAEQAGIRSLSIVSRGGFGIAESIDRDWSFLADSIDKVREEYKGPSLQHTRFRIDTSLNQVYQFVKTGNSLLCEYDDKGSCISMQLNDPVNYVRYHLVSLLEEMKATQITIPLNALILGCTHYPYLRDTIASVLKELYQVKEKGQYRYRNVLAPQVELIDPAVETAKEAYQQLRNYKLAESDELSATNQRVDGFFIAIPNTELKETELQADGWFTYSYKYGRKVGEKKEYVRFVPFDQVNISAATYQRFSQALPLTFERIQSASHGMIQAKQGQ